MGGMDIGSIAILAPSIFKIVDLFIGKNNGNEKEIPGSNIEKPEEIKKQLGVDQNKTFSA